MENKKRFSQINLAGLLLLLVGMGTLLYYFINLNERVTKLETNTEVLKAKNSKQDLKIATQEEENAENEAANAKQITIIEALKSGSIRNAEKLNKLVKIVALAQGIPFESCSEYADYGIIDKGEYLIDPDGYGGYAPFNVTCEFYYTATVTKVFQNSSNAPSQEQLISLIRNSSQCNQEIGFLYCKDEASFQTKRKS